MQSQDEIAGGVALLEGYVNRYGLSLSSRRLRETWSHYFEVTGGEKSFDFVLSDEFLMDIPGTSAYQTHVAEYFPAILTRFQNFSPRDFLSKTGKPFELRIHWPFRQHPSRDVVWCHADVVDLRSDDQVALTAPTVLGISEFRNGPFARIEAVVNAVRSALDKSEIRFYKRSQHPSETQEIRILDKMDFGRIPESAIEEFIRQKVWWLAFKRGDQSTRAWIADPWDAKCLGVGSADLCRAAQVLRAQGVLSLTPDGQFAGAGDGLLQALPPADPTRSRIGFQAPTS